MHEIPGASSQHSDSPERSGPIVPFIYFPEHNEYRPMQPVEEIGHFGNIRYRLDAIVPPHTSDEFYANVYIYTGLNLDEFSSKENWNITKIRQFFGIQPRLVRMEQQDPEATQNGVAAYARRTRRNMMRYSLGIIGGTLIAAVTSKCVDMTRDYSDALGWKSDLDNWLQFLYAAGIDDYDIEGEAIALLKQKGITFEADALVLPDGDRMFMRSTADSDTSRATLSVFPTENGGDELCIRLTELNSGGFRLRDDFRFLGKTGTRNPAQENAFITWQDRRLQSETRVEVVDARFAKEWSHRGLRCDINGDIVSSSGQRVLFLVGDVKPNHVLCNIDSPTGDLLMVFQMWHKDTGKYQTRVVRFDNGGNVTE